MKATIWKTLKVFYYLEKYNGYGDLDHWIVRWIKISKHALALYLLKIKISLHGKMEKQADLGESRL